LNLDRPYGVDDAEPSAGKRKAPRGARGCLIEIATTLLLTIAIFWLVQTFVAQPFQVKQQSMQTTLQPEEYVLVDKLTPRFSPFARGDIVVFDPVRREGSCDSGPSRVRESDGTPYIKRVIGEPGDIVALREERVAVNGQPLVEPYVDGASTDPIDEQSEWVVPADRLFVLGDNRQNSIDSRSETVGLVCVRDIVGRAWVRYWPITELTMFGRPTYATE
jgi:signal peptidase I